MHQCNILIGNRDADLGFYVKRVADGKSVRVPGIIHFDENGVPEGHPDLVFDIERNWLLVRGMLQTDINVQYLFISLPLKYMLLDHAVRMTGHLTNLANTSVDYFVFGKNQHQTDAQEKAFRSFYVVLSFLAGAIWGTLLKTHIMQDVAPDETDRRFVMPYSLLSAALALLLAWHDYQVSRGVID